MQEIDKLYLSENLTKGKRIFRADRQYIDQEIIQLFESNGFKFKKGNFDINNPLEIGISNDINKKLRDRDYKIAQEVGIEMPKVFSPIEILQTSDSIVAKIPEKNRGESKYLLETKEQKIKFISWALIYQNNAYIFSEKNRDVILDRIFENVSQGIFTDPYIEKRGCLNSWVFEEFINTPGKFYSSIRVVVDAFGNFHYAQITKSQQFKNSEILPSPTFKESIFKEALLCGFPFKDLLTRKDSPFYLKSKKFISNVAQGGDRIILDGNSVEDLENRELLISLGINPDKPLLLRELIEKSKEIGKIFRQHYPHAGIDYLIQENTKKPFLLEINKGPHLSALALGLPEDTNPENCELELMRKVILNIK